MAIRELRPPLDAQQLRPLGPDETRVQFSTPLSDRELDGVAALLAAKPDVALRAYGGYGGTIPDLGFLGHFPTLTQLHVDIHDLRSLAGIESLPANLHTLGLGWTKRRISLRPIGRFAALRRLYLEGHTKDLATALAGPRSLEALTLRSITLPDLADLLPLASLRALDLKLGGTRDLRLLPRIGRLEYVELWLVRGMDDVSTLADLPALEHLFLQALRNVTRLPSFAGSANLRRVDLETMKSLDDLAPVAAAPSLEILNLVDFGHARPDILHPFVGHPRLRAGSWGFGSDRKNFAAQDLLPLPPEPWGYAEARGRPPMVEGAPWERPDWQGYRRHPYS